MILRVLTLICVSLCAIACITNTAFAQQTQRFEVVSSSLYVDLDVEYYDDGWSGDYFRTDSKIITRLLFQNPAVDTVILTGAGGDAYQSLLVSKALQVRNIRTIAEGECLSACAVMFLGGKQRFLGRGAVLGFHRANWDVDDAQDTFEQEKSRMGWSNEFDFAVWLHKSAQIDAKMILELAVQQGIDPTAVVHMLTADADDIWMPTIDQMERYKIIDGVVSDER